MKSEIKRRMESRVESSPLRQQHRQHRDLLGDFQARAHHPARPWLPDLPVLSLIRMLMAQGSSCAYSSMLCTTHASAGWKCLPESKFRLRDLLPQVFFDLALLQVTLTLALPCPPQGFVAISEVRCCSLGTLRTSGFSASLCLISTRTAAPLLLHE